LGKYSFLVGYLLLMCRTCIKLENMIGCKNIMLLIF
jgi:hypothetical protein